MMEKAAVDHRNALVAVCSRCSKVAFITTNERRTIMDANDEILDLLLDGYDLIFTDRGSARAAFGCECHVPEPVGGTDGR